MEVLIRMVALVVERCLVLHLVVVLHRVVDVVRAAVLHLAVEAPWYQINGEPTQRKDPQ